MRIKFTLLALLSVMLLSGCSKIIYKPDLHQGNYLAPGMAQSVTNGMSQEQVLYLLGSPITKDVFNPNVWIYVFRQEPTREALTQEMLVITFNDELTVSSIDYKPASQLNQ